MADLLTQVVEVFTTPVGRGVLALAFLALLALAIAAFWGSIRMPRRDVVAGEVFETVPPPVLAPQWVTRGGDAGLAEDRAPWARNALLIVIALMFAGILLTTMRLAQTRMQTAAAQALAEAQPTQEAAATLQTSAEGQGMTLVNAAKLPCVPAGSLQNRSVEVCEAGASVRLDLMRLHFQQREVMNPLWDDAAPTFVRSDTHAAPFGLAQEMRFAAPVTVEDGSYDGYLVVGVAKEGEELTALARAEALRHFAVDSLSGGDRAQCLGEERVYTATATFDASSAEALNEQRQAVAALARYERDGDAAQRRALEKARQDLAQAELLLAERPAPLILGIKADPVSSDPDADMKGASARFLEAYGAALQLKSVGPIHAVRACIRGEGIR